MPVVVLSGGIFTDQFSPDPLKVPPEFTSANRPFTRQRAKVRRTQADLLLPIGDWTRIGYQRRI